MFLGESLGEDSPTEIGRRTRPRQPNQKNRKNNDHYSAANDRAYDNSRNSSTQSTRKSPIRRRDRRHIAYFSSIDQLSSHASTDQNGWRNRLNTHARNERWTSIRRTRNWWRQSSSYKNLNTFMPIRFRASG